ncbi:MAG: uroporphyrinogen-III C-methyltransferase [Dehalococcoidales bacterium]|nr:uroporphyrinogen-III C-methyltransferase [Dehalococcoidales bacterium]
MLASGTVYLVGAGPGDPGLITVRGREYLAAADVVVYDRLVDKRLLGLAKAGARLVYVGKAASHHTLDQDTINELLVREARAGHAVVRLKGGDPFVFGRGGEEAEALVAAGIPFVLVPGVTSAVAVPAYAGIPVTHRDCASSFAVITGHEDPTKDGSRIAWDRLAGATDTLIFLMGVSNLAAIVEQLTRHGLPTATPVALVRYGTTLQQETLVGTLADIVGKVAAADFRPPAVVVVGEVVRLRDGLRWFDRRPLWGRRVLVTRSREQASTLVTLLEEQGAQVWELPTIRIVEPADFGPAERALDSLATYDWVVFTSANGVERSMHYLMMRGKDARAFGRAKIAAIGPATAAALADYGLRADYVPTAYVAEALAAGLVEQGAGGGTVLLARAAAARDVLPESLRAAGAEVTAVAVYDTAVPEVGDDEAARLLREGKIDFVTFTSSSTVRNFHRMFGGDLGGLLATTRVACIGPITARTARELGLRVDVEAQHYTIPGLVAGIVEHVPGTPAGPAGAGKGP